MPLVSPISVDVNSQLLSDLTSRHGFDATIFLARSFITMDDATPRATCAAAQVGEIVAGELDDVVATVGDDGDDRFFG